MNSKKMIGVIILSIVVVLGITFMGSKVLAANETEGAKVAETTEVKEDNSKATGLIAAAVSTGIGCIGAGIAVAVVASAAVGAVSENPSLLGKTIIFAGLAEGIAIYGLIIAIMILNKV